MKPEQIEVYKSVNPGMPCMVYFVVYDNSIQEQQYLTSVRSEKEAFEQLIMFKAGMTPSTDQVADFYDQSIRLDDIFVGRTIRVTPATRKAHVLEA